MPSSRIRAARSEDFEAQERLVTSVRFDVVTRRTEETRFEFRHTSGSPLVQELANQAERVDLVVMLTRRKGEQLCFQVR
jgi:nucleotide-binding universal stress UspA family protein